MNTALKPKIESRPLFLPLLPKPPNTCEVAIMKADRTERKLKGSGCLIATLAATVLAGGLAAFWQFGSNLSESSRPLFYNESGRNRDGIGALEWQFVPGPVFVDSRNALLFDFNRNMVAKVAFKSDQRNIVTVRSASNEMFVLDIDGTDINIVGSPDSEVLVNASGCTVIRKLNTNECLNLYYSMTGQK